MPLGQGRIPRHVSLPRRYPVRGHSLLRGSQRQAAVTHHVIQHHFQLVLLGGIPLALARLRPQVLRVARRTAYAQGNQVVFFIVLGVGVGVAIVLDCAFFSLLV